MVCNILGLGLLSIIVNLVAAESDELLLKYIEDTVIQGLSAADTYKAPENAYQYEPSNKTITEYGTFDYIIVGAGAAGAVLATRLSEDQGVSILLIEAGGRATTFVNIVGMADFVQLSEFNWHFPTTPQQYSCLGMVGHQCFHPRGKGLGGSTLINGMVYSRGPKHDYNSWALAGNPGWSYKNVLPYFKKSENFQADGDYNYHGKGGLLNVEYTKPFDTIHRQFLKANQEVGRKLVDYNGQAEVGVSPSQQNVINGWRQHTAKAFLEKAENRNNLNILTHSYATKVEIDKRHSAQGVLFDHDGKSFRAHAKKEVIISAGSFGSPQLLMLSGIGPSEHLHQLKIPLVKDLPVGQNLQDHATFWALYFTTNYTDPLTFDDNIRSFIKGYGPFTIGAGDAVGFIRTKSSRTPKDVPNIELILEPINHVHHLLPKMFNYDNETFNTVWSPINPKNTFRVIVYLLKPQSRGSVKLKSSSPYEYPLINPNLLSDQNNEDIQGLYEGILSVLELQSTNAFQKIDAKLYYKVLPACQNYPKLSKEQWFCQIRHLTSHIYHPVGTCKMGLVLNGGVVDNTLKVHGIKKLRVVDASVIPDAVSGHTSASTTMIAEKVADMLRV